MNTSQSPRYEEPIIKFEQDTRQDGTHLAKYMASFNSSRNGDAVPGGLALRHGSDKRIIKGSVNGSPYTLTVYEEFIIQEKRPNGRITVSAVYEKGKDFPIVDAAAKGLIKIVCKEGAIKF